MATTATNTKQRHYCDHDGCAKSYLRTEHLNRHRLTHQKRAFSCFLCKKPFTRNDLLQAHIRRHEESSLENADKQPENIPPRDLDNHQGSPRKRTKAGWDSEARPFAPPGEIDFGSTPLQQAAGGQNSPSRKLVAEPEGFPLERVIFGAAAGVQFRAQDEFYVDPELPSDEQQVEDFEAKLMISDNLYRSLLVELPILATFAAGNRPSLQGLFLSGFEYLECFMPLFHRPTCGVAVLKEPIVLAVCSLGGALSTNPDDRELGLFIYKHLHSTLHMVCVAAATVDISDVVKAAKDKGSAWLMAHVPVVLIIDYIGYYALDHEEHLSTDVTHAMTTTILRQEKFLSQSSLDTETITRNLDERWKIWIDREYKIRLAYSIFLADIKSYLHSMRSSILSASMLDLPLPCLTSIWQAATAVEWENELLRFTELSKSSIPHNFRQSAEMLLAQGLPSSEHDISFRDPLILDILLHAIVSEILDLGRAIPTASSAAIDLLKRSDLTNGLVRWKSYFDQMDIQSQETEIAGCTLATYHLACILLREKAPATIESRGTDICENWSVYFSSRENDESSDKQASFEMSREACIHAIKIIALYLQKSTSIKFRSFHQIRTTTIACVVLTTYMSDLKQQNKSKAPRPETAELNASDLLKLLGDEENLISSASSGLSQAAMAAAIQLVTAVNGNVALHPGGMSPKCCQVLDGLLGTLS